MPRYGAEDMAPETVTPPQPDIVTFVPDMKKIALGFFPLTPVSFTHDQAWLAWARLVGFSAVAYLAFGKARKISYAAMGCAGTSLVTSILADYNKKV